LWPGNIRELENLMERVVLFSDGPKISARDLPDSVKGQSGVSVPESSHAPGETPLKEMVKARAAELEKEMIAKALTETDGNVTRAARLLQISRKSLQTKMKEFGLRDDSPPADES
jgi:two-component system response regulator AtoC